MNTSIYCVLSPRMLTSRHEDLGGLTCIENFLQDNLLKKNSYINNVVSLWIQMYHKHTVLSKENVANENVAC